MTIGESGDPPDKANWIDNLTDQVPVYDHLEEGIVSY